MQVHDEISHFCNVDSGPGLFLPRLVSAGVVWKYTYHVQFFEILELDPVKTIQFTTKHQMEKLLLRCRRFVVHLRSPDRVPKCGPTVARPLAIGDI